MSRTPRIRVRRPGRLALICSLVGLVAGLPPASTFAQAPVRTIGLSTDGPVEESAWLVDVFRNELEALAGTAFDLRFPEAKRLEAGGTFEGAKAAHDRLLADPAVDLVVALGPLVSREMVARRDLPKPVIAPFVIDVLNPEIPRGPGGGSGVPNLCFVEPVFDFAHDVERFRELVDFRRMAVLGPEGVIGALSLDAEQQAALRSLDLRLDTVALTGDPAALVAALPEDTQAAYVIGLPRAETDARDTLYEALHARGIATFAVAGENGVRAGALAGLTPADWWPRLMRRTALDARRILTGQPAAEIPTQLARGEQYFVNMETARRLGIAPTFALMSDARLVGELTREPERSIDLRDAMREAIERNRDVRVARRALEAGRDDVSIAWSQLLPQVEATLGYRIIDEDRAARASVGAERTLAAGGSVSQVLWSERALAGVSVQRSLVRALEASLRQSELDAGLQAATGYFDVLSATAVESIRRETLQLTRSNLERARLRLRLGAASPAEEARWESQVAQDQDALVTSIAQRNLTEIELNRVLHLPLEEKLGLADPATGADVFRYLDPRFLPWIDDPAGLRVLRAFASDVALEQAPELARIDAAIAVQERLLSSETRSFFSPELALTGELTRTLERDGAGADALDRAPLDDTDWQVQLGLSLPLFEGAGRLARRGQLRTEILRLEREREAAAERIEQRVRSAVHLASASFTRITLTERAEAAARRNFELVADAYAEGAVSIIELLDAQTAFVNAQQQQASASFQFLSDVMEVERASGGFIVLQTPEERDDVFRRLDEFAAATTDATDAAARQED